MIDPLSPEQVSDEAALLPIQDIVAYLQEHLGQRMTAYISGVKDPKMVARWISRQNMPRDEAQIRLREKRGQVEIRLEADVDGGRRDPALDAREEQVRAEEVIQDDDPSARTGRAHHFLGHIKRLWRKHRAKDSDDEVKRLILQFV